MKRRLIFIVAVVLCMGFVPRPLGFDQGWKKSLWLENAFETILSQKYPRIKAISYWHERWENADGVFSNLRLDSSLDSLDVYRTQIQSSQFMTDPVFSGDKGNLKLVPLQNKIYLSAFPDLGGSEDVVTTSRVREFESLVGKSLPWVYFSNNWYEGIHFPVKAVQRILSMGKVPFIRLMMRSRSQSLPDPKYNLQDFVDGRYDEALYQWAKEAKQLGVPLILEFGTEVNGDWFPWSGAQNGGGNQDGFWDSSLADGPERFQHAYRHLVRIFREVGVADVTWFFHVDGEGAPSESWNRFSHYYPGDEWVDWIGLSLYGPIRPEGIGYESFESKLSQIYPELAAISPHKPLAIIEWGITENQMERNAAKLP